MPASPFVDPRIVLLCHTVPTADTPRLWRWIEAAQRLGDLWLLAPAGPSLHLHQWSRLSHAAERLAIEPVDPLARPRRYQRAFEQWCGEASIDAVVATAPELTRVVDTGEIPVKLMDVSTPREKRGNPLRLPLRIRESASPAHASWTAVAAPTDPLVALEQRLQPRSKAA